MKRINYFIIFISVFLLSANTNPKKPVKQPIRFALEAHRIPEVYPPTALIAESIGEGVRLEWNPSLCEEIVGYMVYAVNGETFTALTKECITETSFVDVTAAVGQKRQYATTAVNRKGIESPYSNIAILTYAPAPAPTISWGETVIKIPRRQPIVLERVATILFNSGQKLVFDPSYARMRAWIAPNGTHLLSPEHYGNALDVTEMDNWGMPEPKPATPDYPATPEPYTLPTKQLLASGAGDSGTPQIISLEPVSGGVCIYYSLPLKHGTNRNFTRMEVWETWTEAEKKIGEDTYLGFNRKIELKIPSFFKEGYSVCLNDAFGVNASCDGAVSYEVNWGNPFLEEVRWSRSRQPSFKRGSAGNERATGRYHPEGRTLQTHPFHILNYKEACILLSALRLYHSVYANLSNYARQGQDGIFPNFMVDCAERGDKHTVEVFEYLYCPKSAVEPPQRYMDATFHYRRRVADLYQLPKYLSGFTQGWDWPYKRYNADDAINSGMDMIGHAHHFWFSAPYAVEPEILRNSNHPVNREIKDYVRSFTDKGITVSFWVRPEFVKTSPANAFSEGFKTSYYGYNGQVVPPIMDKLAREGLPVIRSHPEWIRYGKDGRLAAEVDRTAYSWIPVKLSSGWYDEILRPTIERMADLGFSAVFQDGGAGGMVGVEYDADGSARATMPYYWRWFQDVSRVGMEINGELPLAWGSSVIPTPTEEDAFNPWAVSHQIMRGNLDGNANMFSPRYRHIIHSMYAGAYMRVNSGEQHAKVARFCQAFVKEHGHPDRVKLVGLRWDFLDPSGNSAARGWVWDKVMWEYDSGKSVEYPKYLDVFQEE